MIKHIKLFIPFFLLFNFYFLINCAAQTINPAQKTAVVDPKLILVFGGYKTGNKISVAEVKKLMKTKPALVLKDDKGKSYTIVSFEFSWRQKSVDDDVETGKPKTTYTSVGAKIKGSLLGEDWEQEINETLHAGDEFNFSTIIYYNQKTNKTYLAPELKISITN